jgi:hypothetical protein
MLGIFMELVGALGSIGAGVKLGLASTVKGTVDALVQGRGLRCCDNEMYDCKG